MQMGTKQIASLVLAGLFSLGMATAVPDRAEAEAALQQEEGASNEFSRRMRSEEDVHEQKVRTIRTDYRRNGDRGQYDAAMEAEQLRHDNMVSGIRDEYNRTAGRGRKSV
mgnify:CR=1 FL=1